MAKKKEKKKTMLWNLINTFSLQTLQTNKKWQNKDQKSNDDAQVSKMRMEKTIYLKANNCCWNRPKKEKSFLILIVFDFLYQQQQQQN